MLVQRFDPTLTDCIINDNHDYLLEFLEGLAVPEHSGSIQDWDTAGRVYLDYIRVIKSLQEIQQVGVPTRWGRTGRTGGSLTGFWCLQTESSGYQLERLYTDVTSLCSRIELLPCRTARDHLAQSGESTNHSAGCSGSGFHLCTDWLHEGAKLFHNQKTSKNVELGSLGVLVLMNRILWVVFST